MGLINYFVYFTS